MAFNKFVMMMMMNCSCGMIDWRKAFSLISSRDHCRRSSPSRISDTPRARFKPAPSLSTGFVEWSCAVVIYTTPRRHYTLSLYILYIVKKFVFVSYFYSVIYSVNLFLCLSWIGNFAGDYTRISIYSVQMRDKTT